MHTLAPADYPDAAEKVGVAIRSGLADRGVVLCGSGVGAVMAANRMEGNPRRRRPRQLFGAPGGGARRHERLAPGARVIGGELARDVVRAFLGARFIPEERYRRRIGKMEALAKRYGTPAREGQRAR